MTNEEYQKNLKKVIEDIKKATETNNNLLEDIANAVKEPSTSKSRIRITVWPRVTHFQIIIVYRKSRKIQLEVTFF